jgi:hypothetical protein
VSNSASSNQLINNNPFQELANKNKSPEVQQPAAPAPSNKLINNNPFQELANKNKSPEVQQPAAPASVKI